jgi:hypothetical protein
VESYEVGWVSLDRLEELTGEDSIHRMGLKFGERKGNLEEL